MDVEAALVALASSALYPNGIASPSLPGPDCRILIAAGRTAPH